MSLPEAAQHVLNFWYKETSPEQWFDGGDRFDQEVTRRFSKTLEQAKAGEMYLWRDTLQGRLAEIIVLDQFSRNIYRGQAEAFASDDMALALAQEALKVDGMWDLEVQEKQFLYMPFMHSESLLIHEEFAQPLFQQAGLEDSFKFQILHIEQIKRFGRYPFRNEALGRESTAEEITFMKENKGF